MLRLWYKLPWRLSIDVVCWRTACLKVCKEWVFSFLFSQGLMHCNQNKRHTDRSVDHPFPYGYHDGGINSGTEVHVVNQHFQLVDGAASSDVTRVEHHPCHYSVLAYKPRWSWLIGFTRVGAKVFPSEQRSTPPTYAWTKLWHLWMVHYKTSCAASGCRKKNNANKK